MKQAPAIFLGALLGAFLFILCTQAQLPPVVASHFGSDNLANGHMTRAGYRNFMLFFTIVLPVLVALPLGWLPARFPRVVTLPDRDYWLAPARREATLAFLRAQGFHLGTLLTLFMAAMHFILLQANASQPPQLPLVPFLAALLTFLMATGFWSYRFLSRFRKRPLP